jgi:hypothetical protein
MALVLDDRVQETTTVTGTGTATLLGAVQDFQSFAAIGNANTTYYTIAGQGTSEWEVGLGTYTSSGTTLARTTVLESSNAGSLVNFSAGTKNVFVTYPASQAVLLTGTQTLTNKTLTTPNINSAQFATVSGTAPIYPCRAWVNFNGTGTVAIRSSGNVTSITDNGVGVYTVNFTTAMPDANYSAEVTGANGSAKVVSGTGQATWGWAPYNFNAADVSVNFWLYTGASNAVAASDAVGTYASVAIFR